MEPISDIRAPGAVVMAESKSAASWSAIIAGAFVATAVSVVLFALGSGLGFAMISPWNDQGIAITTFAATTAIWLIVIQWLSSAAGGYMAGRLRTRWIGTHPHEVFFRDTAHGFVTWAVSTVLVAAVLCFSLTSVIGAGMHAATAATMGSAQRLAGAALPSYAYGLDRLLRTDAGSAAAHGGPDPRTEVTDVIVQAAASNSAVSEADRGYLANLVAVNTGVSADDAQRRVNDFIAAADQARGQVKASVDSGRKMAAKTAIYGALALAVGAFIASLSAAMGGKLRDEHP
ncbi:MAG TPA: hypothetical protein VK700_08610 [Steroidobacteraceae bacterium]|jgi:hypothetical protein|nr:hypothetical protein [Steroidobacteraceae bacterium]